MEKGPGIGAITTFVTKEIFTKGIDLVTEFHIGKMEKRNIRVIGSMINFLEKESGIG